MACSASLKSDVGYSLFLVAPIPAATRDEAVAREEREFSADPFVEAALALFGSLTDIDLSAFDLDAVLPYMTTNGEQGALESVADEIEAVMDKVGDDGFLIITALIRVSRCHIGEIT